MKNFVLILLLLSVFETKAQEFQKATHYNAWYSLHTNIKLTNEWDLSGLVQTRHNQVVTHWQQTYLQLAISRKLHPNFDMALGTGWVHFFPYGEFKANYAFNELRIWEQLAYKFKIKKLLIHHRFRWEHRYLERKALNIEGSYQFTEFMYKNRLRYRLLLKYPTGKWSISISNEGFLDLGNNTFNNISQNRFVGTVGKKLNKSTTGTLGYMYQTIWKGGNRNKLERNHTLLVGLSINLGK